MSMVKFVLSLVEHEKYCITSFYVSVYVLGGGGGVSHHVILKMGSNCFSRDPYQDPLGNL